MISRFFIDRPIFAAVLSIALTIAGAISVFSLPISQYPPITPPTVQVSVNYPGASAQVVADTVAAPIEQQVNGVDQMIYMCSTSDNSGYYNLIVTFAIGTDLNTALVMVQNRVTLAIPQLPESVQKQGLTIKKKAPNVLLAINFYSPDGRYDDLYLSNYATIHVKDEIFRLEGVGDITYLGERDYSIRAWLDPQKMAAHNITTDEVVDAISKQNTQLAPGQVGQQPVPYGQVLQMPLNGLGRLTTPEQFDAIIIRSLPGGTTTSVSSQVVRLKDVARMELGASFYYNSATVRGYPSATLAVFQLPGSNALDVGDRIRSKMLELSKKFPQGLEYEIGYDTTPFIRDSVVEVFRTLVDAVVLVAVVVLIFLQSWRATLIPLVAVPVAIVGTFAVMAAVGFSLNNISLFGLVLAIGIVVDDAIVVVENVERWMEQGYSPRESARKAMDEVTGPVVAVALVLCAVFVPCAFISGVTGQFFRQFAVTIAISTVFSAFNSLTLSPALAAILLRHRHKGSFDWVTFGLFGVVGFLMPAYLRESYEMAADWSWPLFLLVWGSGGALVGLLLFLGFNKAFDFFTNAYGRVVGFSLRLSLVVLAIYGGLLYLTYWSFGQVPTGFIPQQDQGWLMVNVQLPDSASLQRTQEVMAECERIALKTPGVKTTTSTSGYSLLLSMFGSNYASMFVILDPFDKRKTPELQGEAIMKTLRAKYRAEIHDAMVAVFGAPPVPGLGTAGGFKVMVEDRGDLGASFLQEESFKLIGASRRLPGIASTFTQYRAETPMLYADIDRTKVESLGVTVKQVNQTLEAFIGSVYVNNFNEFGRYWQVNVQAEGDYRDLTRKLHLLKMRNKKGEMVPLSTVVELRDSVGPGMVMRYNLYESAPINGNVTPGTSSGQGIKEMTAAAQRVLPRAMQAEWTELSFLQVQEAQDWRNQLVFPLAVVFVFLVLAALYESWALPLAVILVVPMCLLSAVAGVACSRLDINIFTQIGFVVLVGLASKNAILIVEFARQLRQEGKPLFEATTDACRLRLRPILMTSFAFILGVVPLVIATGAGWEMRRALGTAVFSGMLGVTIFGILLTPVFFYVIQWLGERSIWAIPEVRWVGSIAMGMLVSVPLGIRMWILAESFPTGLPIAHLVVRCLAFVGGLVPGGIIAFLVMGMHRRSRPPLSPPASGAA